MLAGQLPSRLVAREPARSPSVMAVHVALSVLLLPALALVLLAGVPLAAGQSLARWGSKARRTPLGVGGSGGGLGG